MALFLSASPSGSGHLGVSQGPVSGEGGEGAGADGGVPSSISRPHGWGVGGGPLIDFSSSWSARGGGGYGQQSVFKVCSLPKVAQGAKSF